MGVRRAAGVAPATPKKSETDTVASGLADETVAAAVTSDAPDAVRDSPEKETPPGVEKVVSTDDTVPDAFDADRRR